MGVQASAAITVVDDFVRAGGESDPSNLQNHIGINGSTWLKTVGAANLRLSGTSSSLTESGTSLVAYYNSSSVPTDSEVGLQITRGTLTGTYNYMGPMIRTNSSATNGIWAEVDLTNGTVGLRRLSGFAYINTSGTFISGFSFPADDYYTIIGASGSSFSMYVKKGSSGLWLNPATKLFDSPTRIAVATGTDTQVGTNIGVASFLSGGTMVGQRFEFGNAGDLTGTVTVPTVPQTVKIGGGNNQITLSWSAPSYAGGTPITSYNIYNSVNNTLATTTSGAMSVTFSGLTNGNTYSYYVTAVNSTGESASSSVASAIPKTPYIIDTFTRQESESGQYLLQDHTASNGTNWIKTSGPGNYYLSAASSSVLQSTTSVVTYYNTTAADDNLEVGLLINKNSAVGQYNYMTPIVRANAASSSGIWAEADLTSGTIGLRMAYAPYSYISVSSPVTGYTFPQDNYYIVLGAVGNDFSMYMKRMSTGLWLSPSTKLFDSSSRIAVASGTRTQLGTYVGMGGYITSGSPQGKQIDLGSIGELTSPLSTTTPLTIPSAPQNPVASSGNTQLSLSWSAPGTNGGSTISSYKVYNSSSNTVATTTAGTSVTITGLTNAQMYSYYITAVNTTGESASSTVFSGTPAVVIATQTIAVSDAAFQNGLSPYVWYSGSGYITSAGGSNAYIKTGFTGTSFALNVDVSTQVAASMSAIAYPVIKYRIDGGAYTLLQLTSTSSIVTLARGLVAGNHTVEAYYQRNIYYDSWNTPVEQLKITGTTIDEGAALYNFPTFTKRMLIYGDSIAEGQWIEETSSGNTGTTGKGALIANSTRVYTKQLADNLGAEFGNVAVAGQGWTAGGLTNVPGLTTAWDLYSSGRSRLVGGKITPAPEYVFINMGTNGGVSAASTVTNWLTSLRASLATSSIIYLNVPFNGSGRANITSGYNTYMASNVADRTYLIDLGTISGYTTTDELHPDGPGNDVVAGLLTNAINSITVPSVPTSVTATSSQIGMTLNWGIPTSNGSSTILGYNIYNSNNVLVSSTTSTSTLITSYTDGVTYTFSVRAYNALGESSASSVSIKAHGVLAVASVVPPRITTVTGYGGSSSYVPSQQVIVPTAPVTQPQISFTKTLQTGMTNPEVKTLQQYLNSKGFIVSKSGAGSVGKETNYFGPATRSALARFQKANNITPAVGFFGPVTRGFILSR